MSYYHAKTISVPFDEAVSRTMAALKEQGFGVITEIDVKDTLKKKIGVDFRPYRILGACNPVLAYEALKIGQSWDDVAMQRHHPGGRARSDAVKRTAVSS